MDIGFIYAIGAAVLWGLVYTIDQKILTNVSPIALLFFNSLLTAIIMLPFVLNSGIKPLLFSGKNNVLLMILSIVLATLANFFIFSSIKTLGSSTASIIEIAYPFFVVLFTYIIFRSTPNIYFLIGGLLVFAGSVIIIKFA